MRFMTANFELIMYIAGYNLHYNTQYTLLATFVLSSDHGIVNAEGTMPFWLALDLL